MLKAALTVTDADNPGELKLLESVTTSWTV